MGTEKCPFCGQEIEAEATRCFFCGARLDAESVERRLEQLHVQEGRRSARRVGKPVVLELVVALILACVVLFHGERSAKRSSGVAGPLERSMVRLNAEVTFAGSRFVISNKDSFDWENVKLEVTSGVSGESFALNVPKIPAGETYAANSGEFSRTDGNRFDPVSMTPQRFWIRCDTPQKKDGSYIAGWK